MSLVDQANLILAMVLFVAGKHIACKVSTPQFSSLCYAVHPPPTLLRAHHELAGDGPLVLEDAGPLRPAGVLPGPGLQHQPVHAASEPPGVPPQHLDTRALTQWPLLLLLPCLLAHFAVSQYTLKCDDVKALV